MQRPEAQRLSAAACALPRALPCFVSFVLKLAGIVQCTAVAAAAVYRVMMLMMPSAPPPLLCSPPASVCARTVLLCFFLSCHDFALFVILSSPPSPPTLLISVVGACGDGGAGDCRGLICNLRVHEFLGLLLFCRLL